VFLTLPLLSRSRIEFFVAACGGWTAIFASTAALTRALARTPRGVSSAVGKPLAQSADRVARDPVANDARLERNGGGAAHSQKRPD
jgi:hypothetical protein